MRLGTLAASTVHAAHVPSPVGQLVRTMSPVTLAKSFASWSVAPPVGRIEPRELAEHAPAVVQLVNDKEPSVCAAALQTLTRLEPASMARFAATISIAMWDEHGEVRRAAKAAMVRLESTEGFREGRLDAVLGGVSFAAAAAGVSSVEGETD